MTSPGGAKVKRASATGRPGGRAEGPLPAGEVVARFGGIRPMAAKLGVPVTTVQGWNERGSIPSARRRQVLAAAARHGISLGPELVERGPHPVPRTERRTSAEPAPSPGVRAERLEPPEPRAAAGEAAPEGLAPEPQATGSVPPTAAPSPRRGRRLLIWSGAAVALVVVAVLAGQAYVPWQEAFAPGEAGPPANAQLEVAIEAPTGEAPQPVAGAFDEARLAALERRLDDLIAKVETLAAAPEAQQAGAEAVASDILARLEERIAALESAAPADSPQLRARLRAVEERLAEARGAGEGGQTLARRDDVETLSRRLAALEQRQGAAEAAFLLAVMGLGEALRSSGPFADGLAALRAVAGGDPEVEAALAGFAERADDGIPTLAQLRTRFARVADAAVRAAASPEPDSWLDRALGLLSGVVTWRRVGGDVPGDEVDAVVARAEAQLKAGDLAAAIEEVERLGGPAAAATSRWLADAQARLEAERGLKALTARALVRLGGEGGG
ncbi:MAG: mitofilin family membrane protein [Alphaproteobacteria bacterium]